MRTRRSFLGSIALLLALTAVDVDAQRGGRRPGGQQGQPDRQQLEQRLRERLANMLRTELGLNDAQMQQLSDVNQRFDVRRRELLQREFGNRRALRSEVMRGESADQSKIDGLIAEQFRIERERIDLTEAEQRDLGRFLTAVQRAKYMGIQENIRRELDQLRGRGRQGMGPPPDSQQRRRPPA